MQMDKTKQKIAFSFLVAIFLAAFEGVVVSTAAPVIVKSLHDFLEYVDRLQQVDTEKVMPTAHVLPVQNVFREDVVKPSLDRELALSNAPQQEDGYFRVPKILEE